MREPSALAWLALSLVVGVVDQVTKYLAVDLLVHGQSVAVLPGLNWTLLHNYGAAFSFLNQAGGWQRWLFTGLAVVISILLVVWLSRTRRDDWRSALPLALILGGAVGNLVDRLNHGYVIDFIDVYYSTHHWPAFNVADSAISVGAVLLILFGLASETSRETAAK